jgi:hypothetical protein
MIVAQSPVRPVFLDREVLEKLLEAFVIRSGGAGHGAVGGCATGVN